MKSKPCTKIQQKTKKEKSKTSVLLLRFWHNGPPKGAAQSQVKEFVATSGMHLPPLRHGLGRHNVVVFIGTD